MFAFQNSPPSDFSKLSESKPPRDSKSENFRLSTSNFEKLPIGLSSASFGRARCSSGYYCQEVLGSTPAAAAYVF